MTNLDPHNQDESMDPAFEKKVQMVITTFHEVFALCTVSVVLQALATCVSTMLHNSAGTPHERRVVLGRFATQVEIILTRKERGL